ncbi:MAG: hypothetical protein NZ529_04540 [Cytophagaceae bacterium]|nr:hypothetical protein [Cytophagaceae bacterium]MDW8456043.1 hypothetical protein [Cytophagaceae bacterium]
MIRFFKKYDLGRLLLILCILAAIRIGVYMLDIPVLLPELNWLLAGQRMSDGYAMYKSIWYPLEHMSATVYFVLDILFGKSARAHFILSALCVAFQALYFNYITNRYRIYPKASSIPALTYVIFSGIFIDHFMLSPALLGLNFVLPVFAKVCAQTEEDRGEKLFFYCGLYLGIAVLFYLPYLALAAFPLISFLLFSTLTFRRIVIFLVALLFPASLFLVYYFWNDMLEDVYVFFVKAYFEHERLYYISNMIFLKIIIIPALVTIFSFAMIFLNSRYVYYQYTIVRVVFIWLCAGVLSLLMSREFSGFIFFIFLPVVAFYATHLFLLLRKKFISEVTLIAICTGIGLILYYSIKSPDKHTAQNLLVPTTSDKFPERNKKVMVLGENKSYYKDNFLCGPFLWWPSAKGFIGSGHDYESIILMNKILMEERPDAIVDTEKIAERIFDKLPAVNSMYQKTEWGYKKM